jgi:hypothetical protein
MELSCSASSVTGLNFFLFPGVGRDWVYWYFCHYLTYYTSPRWWWWLCISCVEREMAGEIDVPRENLTQFHSVNHKSHMICTLSESRPPQRKAWAILGPSGLNRFNAGRNDINNDDVMLSIVHLRTWVSLYTMSKDGASVWESYGLYTEKTNCSVVLEVTAWLLSLLLLSSWYNVSQHTGDNSLGSNRLVFKQNETVCYLLGWGKLGGGQTVWRWWPTQRPILQDVGNTFKGPNRYSQG